MNVALSALLVVFLCLLAFSVGVISGKGWSDREYTIRHIKKDSHLQAASEEQEPLGEDMTEKEVELLTQRALDQARAEQPQSGNEETVRDVASNTDTQNNNEANPSEENEEETQEDKQPAGREASTAQTKEAPKAERKVSSLIPRPTVPSPKSIEYTVQVAAYKTMQEAEVHCQTLIDKGFPAFPVKALINGEEWFRVSIGSFKNKTQALKYEKALKKQAVVKNTFVQKITRLQ